MLALCLGSNDLSEAVGIKTVYSVFYTHAYLSKILLRVKHIQ